MLIIDADKIKFGDVFLPGIVQSIQIGGSILYEKQESNTSAKRKVMLGYDDKVVSISLILLPNYLYNNELTVYEQLNLIEKLFKEKEDSVPKIHFLIHPHAKNRNINKVLFQNMESYESIETGIITVDLEFIEFLPAEITPKVRTDYSATVDNTVLAPSDSPVKEMDPTLEIIEKGLDGFGSGDGVLR